MADRMEIKEGERRRVRLFAIDLPEPEVADFARPDPDTDSWPLRDALGAQRLDPEGVEILRVADLQGLGLAGYLTEGQGMDAREVDEMRPQLDRVSGYVAVVTSRAFEGRAQVLTPRTPLRWIGTFAEQFNPAPMTPLRSASAEGEIGAPPGPVPPQVSRSRMLALIVFGLAVLAVIVLIVVL